MAKKSVVARNAKRAKKIEAYKEIRIQLKMLARNKSLTLGERMGYVYKLSALPKDSSKVRFMNRCFLSGRARGVERMFGLSRICIRQLASEGKLAGVTKSSW